ncbi:hypothetical protein A3843_09830 [Pseudovibrio exalbescens]|uniref:Uncharacterized protein n=1 Tax=Pseudovibrio exalbescens TaxID=197461 RepID=A0A1U7JIY4_9HYPH|nr:hypothetical protein A3843_09830 [Pseudovibrio exalbescens]
MTAEKEARFRTGRTAEGEKETERNSKRRMKKPAPHLVPDTESGTPNPERQALGIRLRGTEQAAFVYCYTN